MHIEVKGLTLTPVEGQDTLRAEMRLLVYNTAKNGHPASDLKIGVKWPIGGTTNCNVVVDTARSGTQTMRAQADVRFLVDPATGYTKVAFPSVNIDQIDDEDIEVGDCWISGIINLLRGTIIDQMTSSLQDTVRNTLSTQLCQKCQSPSECPNGTVCDGVCKFASGECLQILGTEGRLNLGSLVASLSPGIEAWLDILARAGGPAWVGAATNANGVNLGFFGGARSPTRNACVPQVTPPPLDPVAPAATFIGGQQGPVPFHVGVGIHDSLLNHAMFGIWESGVLCLDVGTTTSDMLHSGTFSLLVPSLADLTHGEAVPVIMSIRPQNPPTVTLGAGTFNSDGTMAEPLLKLAMQDVMVELLALIDERYVRVLSVHTDVLLPLGLRANGNGQIEVVLGDVNQAFTNLRVTDSGMLAESPDEIAAALPEILGAALPTLSSAFPPFDLPAVSCAGDPSKALRVNVPAGGITSVESKRFLGVFATFSVGAATARYRATATVEVADVEVPPKEAFVIGKSFDPRLAPAVTLRFGGHGLDESSRDLEWTYRLDGGFWSPWVRTPEVRIQGGHLWLQGRHRVDVRARLRGAAETESDVVSQEFLIDSLPPELRLEVEGDWVRLGASDMVTPEHRLEYSWRTVGGEFSAWTRATRVPLGRLGLEVRVRDEAGNVAVATVQGAKSSGMEGAVPAKGFEGGAQAGCAVGGSTGAEAGLPGGLAGLLCGLSALGFLGRRSRRRHSASLLRALGGIGLFVMATGLGGCNCGGTITMQDGGSSGDSVYSPGAIGRYASLAVAPDGTLFVAAYEEKYGDLVVGTLGAPPDFTISWEIVDGVPTNARTKGDPRSWRYGIKEAGPNVGFYTSLVVDERGVLHVAYREATAPSRDDPGAYRLKYARKEGTSCEKSFDCWKSHVVDEDGRAGMYASLTLGHDGAPAIASMTPAHVDPVTGRVSSELRFAVASSGTPNKAEDWTVTVVDRVRVSCAGLCGEGSVCAASVARCADQESTGCPSGCPAGHACVASACVPVTQGCTACDSPKVCVTETNICVATEPST